MSFAIPIIVRKCAMVLAVFLFWFTVFGTVKLKKKANYMNYATCVALEGLKSTVQHDPEGAVALNDVKRLSKKYKFSSKQVRVIIENEQKRRDDMRRFIKSNRRTPSTIPTPIISNSKWQLIKNKTEPSFRQKLNHNFEKFLRGTIGVYFKLTGISFSPKPCK